VSAPSPSWYDLLDVEPTATEDEIRAAWKSSIADLDPSDRRFRLANQAAEVLLDPKRRADYDATLAAVEESPEPEPVVPVAGSGVAGAPGATGTTGTTVGGASRTVPVWLLLGLAVVTLAAIGFAAYLWSTPSDTEIEDSTRAAQSAAERAIVPVLSYDHRTLAEDGEAARSYMTSDYRDEYDKLFAVIEENAPGTRTVVDVEVVASGIVRSGEDRVEVLVFLNRPTTNAENKEPVIYKDQVRVQMVNVDDEWLIDCLITTPGATCD
jgi:Mce-associated membrane protein